MTDDTSFSRLPAVEDVHAPEGNGRRIPAIDGLSDHAYRPPSSGGPLADARLIELVRRGEGLRAKRDSIARKLGQGVDAATGATFVRLENGLRETVAELEAAGFPAGQVPGEVYWAAVSREENRHARARADLGAIGKHLVDALAAAARSDHPAAIELRPDLLALIERSATAAGPIERGGAR